MLRERFRFLPVLRAVEAIYRPKQLFAVQVRFERIQNFLWFNTLAVIASGRPGKQYLTTLPDDKRSRHSQLAGTAVIERIKVIPQVLHRLDG